MKCVICGAEFSPNVHNQVTCSPACRYARHIQNNRNYIRKRGAKERGLKTVAKQQNTPKENTCRNCGKQFTPNYAKEKFCSDKCRFQFFHLEEWI